MFEFLSAWSFNAAWQFILSSASIANLIGIAAVAIAVLMPSFLSAITDLRKWAIVVAACAFSYSFVAGKFYHDGLAVKQAEWDAALKRETNSGEQIRQDAESSVPPVVDDDARRMLRGDPYNRDRGKK